MKNVFILNKQEGETPLFALEKFRAKNKKYKDSKMTYAGRLDPMASGLLVILAEQEIKNKVKYLALDKEYKFEILFGFATDTYDILGKVTRSYLVTLEDIELKNKINKNLKYFKGKFKQKYPLYSSKTIKHARAGNSVEAPEREVTVKSLKFIKLRKISNPKLLENIEKRINKVSGDFRQKEILRIWRKNLKQGGPSLTVASFKIRCSSGTYVRVVANELGGRIGIPALAFSIKRSKIGKWSKAM